jgi:hypothetical protein
MIGDAIDKTRENRLRRLAVRKGYRLCKSRARIIHFNNQGLYQLLHAHQNWVIAGANYDWTLDDVEAWLNRQ